MGYLKNRLDSLRYELEFADDRAYYSKHNILNIVNLLISDYEKDNTLNKNQSNGLMLVDIHNENNKSYRTNLENDIATIMKSIGVPINIKGYRYLIDSIILVVNDATILNSITKKLYPTVARKHNTTSTGVERAIRHAIENTWSKKEINSIENTFKYTCCKRNGKPTNSEFIALIADKVRFEEV